MNGMQAPELGPCFLLYFNLPFCLVYVCNLPRLTSSRKDNSAGCCADSLPVYDAVAEGNRVWISTMSAALSWLFFRLVIGRTFFTWRKLWHIFLPHPLAFAQVPLIAALGFQAPSWQGEAREQSRQDRREEEGPAAGKRASMRKTEGSHGSTHARTAS